MNLSINIKIADFPRDLGKPYVKSKVTSMNTLDGLTKVLRA